VQKVDDALEEQCKWTYMMDEAVDDFLDDSFTLNQFWLTLNLILNVLQIPIDKLTASDATVFICTPHKTTLHTTTVINFVYIKVP